MEDIGSALLGKLLQLRQLLPASSSLDEMGAVSTPAEMLDQMRFLARSVPNGIISQPGNPELGIVEDLMAFLASLPEESDAPIRRLASFPPEPATAWDEPSGPDLWLLAALIQDVWEHSFGPEAAADPRIARVLDYAVSGRALDFGCGAGTFAFHLARRGVAVTCVEANPVKRAFLAFRKSRRPEGERISLAPPSGRYDAALAINVLDHLEDPVATARWLAGRLRPGGALIFCAGFPEDGWHQGGEEVREALFRELMRCFRYPEPEEDSGDETVLLRRRERILPRPLPASTRRDRWGSTRARLDPAARLIPHPEAAGQLIFAAPRFYTRPLLLTGHGAVLTRLCGAGLTVAEICRAMTERGITESEAAAALSEMARSRLIVFEAVTFPGRSSPESQRVPLSSAPALSPEQS